MKPTLRRPAPVSIHLERLRCFVERHLKMRARIAAAGKPGAPHLIPSDQRHHRILALPFERRDDDE